MKNRELLELNAGLESLRSSLSGRDFSYAVSLNKDRIRPILVAIDEAKKPKGKMAEYVNQFEIIKKKHAVRDDAGNPMVKDGIDPNTGARSFFYVLPEDKTEYEKERDTLIEIYQDVIQDNEESLQEWFLKFLEEDSDIKIVKINRKELPDDINIQEMHGIMHMINE